LKRREARYSYALEKAVEAAAGAADLILLFLDPTTIHYKVLSLYLPSSYHCMLLRGYLELHVVAPRILTYMLTYADI
jgi:hypothetical protein